MTAKNEYVPQVHTHVMFESAHGLEVGSFEGPCPIVLHVGDRVWVPATCYDLPFQKEADGMQVSDSMNKGFDLDGNCIVSIHVRHVRSYLDEKEAECVVQCMQADADMLANAF